MKKIIRPRVMIYCLMGSILIFMNLAHARMSTPLLRHREKRSPCLSWEQEGLVKEIRHHHIYLFMGDRIGRFPVGKDVVVVFPSSPIGGLVSSSNMSSPPPSMKFKFGGEMCPPILPFSRVKLVMCKGSRKVIKIIVEEVPQ